MKKIYLGMALMAAMAFGASVGAAEKTYQVTGPVLEVSDSKIIVKKGKDRWELVRTPSTKIDGNLAVGSTVTIHYFMTADEVVVKEKK